MNVPAPPFAMAAPVTLKVLSLNTHKGFALFNRRLVLHELREAVRTVGADIVFLQEVIGEHADYSSRYAQWPPRSQYEFLADSIWQAYAYGRNAVYADGHHGNALLAKFPILRYDNHDISTGTTEGRGLLHCVLDVPGIAGGLHTICVHLGLKVGERRAQLRQLCALIEQEVPPQAPLIVAGDFNDWLRRAHAPLQACAGLREVFIETRGRAACSFPARWPLLSLDRVYVRGLRIGPPAVLSMKPWSHLSDHAALLAELHP